MGIKIINAPATPPARTSTPGDTYVSKGLYSDTLFLHVKIGDEHSLIDLTDGRPWNNPSADIDVLLRDIAEDFTYAGTILSVELQRRGA